MNFTKRNFHLKIRLAREGMVTRGASRKNHTRMSIRVKTILHKTPSTSLDARRREKHALCRIEHEDARKSGAYSLHRGEKSEVGPFSEKWVEKVSDCTHERARRAFHPRDVRGRGVAGDDAGRPPPRHPCPNPLSHVVVFRRVCNRTNDLTFPICQCRNVTCSQLAEASIR
jgi:hypothetical protein